MDAIIQKVADAVKKSCEHDRTGHDWPHVERVRKMALRIAVYERGSRDIIELAALVHDVGDHKFHDSEEAGNLATRKLLQECEVPVDISEKVFDIAQSVSFKGVDEPDDMPTFEGKIVQDADRLDAMGPIGIARAFVYGGSKGRPMYDSEIPWDTNNVRTKEQYIGNVSTSTLHHFNEKLLHLQERLHTKTARGIGKRYHQMMEEFVENFKSQWEGNL